MACVAFTVIYAACLGAFHQQALEFEACGVELQCDFHDCAFMLIESSHCIVTQDLADSGLIQEHMSSLQHMLHG